MHIEYMCTFNNIIASLALVENEQSHLHIGNVMEVYYLSKLRRYIASTRCLFCGLFHLYLWTCIVTVIIIDSRL